MEHRTGSRTVAVAIVLLLPFLFIGFSVRLVLSDAVRDRLDAEALVDLTARTHLFEHAQLQPTDLAAPVDGDRRAEIAAWSRVHLQPATTTKLHLWALDGTIVFSTEPGVTGRRQPGKAAELRRIAGSDQTLGRPQSERIDVAGGGQVLETYLGVSGPEGQTRGVLEFYDTAPQESPDLDGLQRRLDIVIAGALAALYALTLPVVHRTLRKVRSQRDDLAAALTSANEAGVVKDRFLEAISHELRTPLTNIVGPAEILHARRRDLAPDAVDMLVGLLHRNSRKLSRILNDVLDVDRLRNGRLTITRERCDIGEVVDEAATDLDLGDRRLDIECEPITVEVDAATVERVVENLLVNAARHTPAGSRISLTAVADGDELVVTVDDDGVGVPAALRDTIFEPFERGDSPLHSPGTGVGLSIVRTFARLHDGDATVSESPDGGARFTVRFAEARPRPLAPTAPATEHAVDTSDPYDDAPPVDPGGVSARRGGQLS